VPRVPDVYMEGAAFLFRTRQEAEKRARIGGTAFVVTKPIRDSETIFGKQMFIPYFVSCRHVVFGGSACIASVNRWDGRAPDILEFEQDEWLAHPAGDDLAIVCAVRKLNAERHKISHVMTEQIITKEGMEVLGVGPGDDVFMVGRFINHQGQKTNRASVRFGNISMMMEDIWVKRDNRNQESIAVEMRSRTGFSGSPVAVYRTDSGQLASVKHKNFWGLLGVNWGYILDEDGENTWLNAR
jgi:hypothetical protein